MPIVELDNTPRVSSIKTRIKTELEWSCSYSWPLREYIPLKQGLRQVRRWPFGVRVPPLREYLPLKQGLRLHQLKAEHVEISGSESIFH